jgi:UDP-N-acetylmuramoyl-tripeptide--D-alanyl-D-alanine ligase
MTFLYILYIVLLLTALVLTKSSLFWVYLWQTKEYRLDRFWAEYGQFKKLGRFWLFSGGRKFHQPIHTLKSILIHFISLAIVSLAIFILLEMFFGGTLSDSWPFIVGLIILYLLMPLIVSLNVLIFYLPTVIIKNIIYRLAAKKMRKIDNLTVIGITGSYGKSSTKEFLAQILGRKFEVIKTPENVNSEIGVAKFVLSRHSEFISESQIRVNDGGEMLKPLDTKVLADRSACHRCAKALMGRQVQYDNVKRRQKIFIVEMGAYKRGEIKRICNIVKPKIGIITGISEQHLSLFGSIENIKRAKFELIESLPEDGLAVFSGENKYCLEMAERRGKKKVICSASDANKYANYTNLPKHYLSNIVAAAEVAKYLGMSDEEIKEAIKNIKLTERMTKAFTGRNGVLIIDDTYSANPDGVLAALDYLARQKQKTKIIVMPCLIELGKLAEEVHHRIGKRIREVCDLAVITTSDYFYAIESEAGDKSVLVGSPIKTIEFLKDKLNSDTAILLEGRLAETIVDFVK